MNSSSEDTSSDSSDMSDDEEEDVEISKEELDQLEEKVKQNLYSYESHVALIAALRSLGDIEKVRDAREQMAGIFPLPEEQWLQWIEDEEALARTPLQKELLAGYYERATQDYQSVTLWERYGSFMEVFLAETEPKRVRTVYEDAVTSVGLHIPQGARIWSAFRAFEFRREETENVRRLYHRQLAIPLQGMEDTFKQYQTWEDEQGGTVAPHVERAFKGAMKQLEERKEYEQKVAGEMSPSSPDYTKLEDWKAYLQFEEEAGNPARVQCLYERVVKGYCLVLDIWKSYISYLEKTLASVHDVIVSVHARAVRNCPWSGDLWSSYIRAMERAQRTDHELIAFFEKGLQAGLGGGEEYLKLFEAQIDYTYRKTKKGEKGDATEENFASLRRLLERAVKHLEESFPGSCLNEKVLRYWAALELHQFGNAEQAVSIWEELIKTHGTEVEAWLEYISLIRYSASDDAVGKCRSLFKRACNGVADWPEKVCEQWLLFEREVGTLEDWTLAKSRCEARLKQVNKLREREVEKYNEAMAQAAREEEAAKKKQEHQKERSKKAKAKRREDKKAARAKQKPQDQPTRKRVREEVTKEKPAGEKEASDTTLETSPKRRKVEPLTAEETPVQQADTNAPTTSEPIVTDGSDPKERTVFVGNLSFSADESKLREVFSKEFGGIAEIRLVRDKNGRSKGFAFLEFSSKGSVPKALDRKDLIIDGRVVGIQEGQKERGANPKDLQSQQSGEGKRKRSYSDQKTVFVSNLSFATTEEDLRQEFADCGNIKAVRLIRDKKQKSKGFAYIQWESEQSVQAALGHNQKQLRGRPLNVALSNPPKKPVDDVFSNLAKRPATILLPRVIRRAKVQLDKPQAKGDPMKTDKEDQGTS